MQRPLFVTWVLAMLLGTYIAPALAGPARPTKQVMYASVHPVPPHEGGGFCNIEGPHVHLYRPDHADELFRVVGGAYLFVGDPVPFGYDGSKHAFYGPHPIPVDEIVAGPHAEHDGAVFCYLEGPHYHIYVPPPTLKFTERGGAYWYVGEWPRSYQLDAPRYRKINVVYEPLLYARPVITASAPVEYHVPVIAVTVPPPPKVIVRPRPIVEVRVPWLVVEEGSYDYGTYYHHRHHRHHDDDDDD
jgi:hypothetical protein